MARSVVLLLTLLQTFITESGGSAHKTPEETYYAARDHFRLQFQQRSADDSAETQDLRALEERLRQLIGPVRVRGFSGQGAISYEGPGDGGANQVDGLLFSSGSLRLFVSTKTLLSGYLKREKTLPTDLDELSRNEEFYSRTLDWEVAFYRFADIPVQSVEGRAIVRALLVREAQDIGPVVPGTITVFVERGARILVAKADLESRLDQIDICKKMWDDFENKSAEARRVNRSSGLKDESALAESRRLEKAGFEAYRRCFGEAVARQPAFSAVKGQAQSLVDRLQGGE